ncbi:Uncharacterised protein [Chromobacterium vaccinii]|nr:Uncharacterised protein [Chromobacterium vaccinii]
MMPTQTRITAVRPWETSSSPTLGPTKSTLRSCTVGSAAFSWPITLSDSWAVLVPGLFGRRIITSRLVPRFCTVDSPSFSASTFSRIWSRLADCWYCSSSTVPPVNSTLKFRPRVARKNTASTKVTSEIAVVSRP